jgi:hypothetical protein
MKNETEAELRLIIPADLMVDDTRLSGDHLHLRVRPERGADGSPRPHEC